MKFRALTTFLFVFGLSGPVMANDPIAKNLFGAHQLPAATGAASHGFYSKGCLAGGVAIARDGPNWQAMRLSRNRRWGHPTMVNLVERLSRDAAKVGWNGLLVGDLSQPRGGPMLSGHASHQIGLDADIWLNPMPNRRYSNRERENISAVSVLKKNSLYVDDRRWTQAHTNLLRTAARYPEVERLLVHPGIKKKLCDTVKGDRSWLNKVRPFWGHHYHFHIRIGCQSGSPHCKRQAAPPRTTGCDKSLAWWFTEEPWRKPKPGTKPRPKARDTMRLSQLPSACRVVLKAPNPKSEQAVTVYGRGQAPRVANAAAAKQDTVDEILSSTASSFAPLPTRDIPLPIDRPGN